MGRAQCVTLAALLAGMVLTRGSARAQSALPFELDWEAPSGCPNGAAVEQDVARRLDGSGAAKRPLRARARVRDAPGGAWTLELVTVQEGTHGSRRVEGQSCEALAEAAAAIFALAIDPDLVTGPIPNAAPEATAPAAPASRPPSASPQRRVVPSRVGAPPPRKRPPVSAFAAFGEGVLFGVLAPARPIIGAGFGLEHGPASLSLFGDYGFKQTTDSRAQDAGVSLALASARISGCHAVFGSGSWLLAPCLGVGTMRASGIGTGTRVTKPQRGWLMWPNAEAGGVVSGRLRGPLRFRLDGAVLVPLDRPAVRLDGLGVVARPYYVEGRLSAGLTVML